MKIVLCNKYYFINGGTEKYLSGLLQQLPRDGHKPVGFSVRYAGSWPSPYARYFLPPPGDARQTHLKQIRFSPISLLRHLERSIYSIEARKRLSQLLKVERDVAVGYILNIYNYMSPSIIHTFRRQGIPVVMQLADYNLLCPSYSFLRAGRPCTLCINGAYHHGVRYRCVRASLPASTVRAVSMSVQRWLKIYHLVDAFVVPCRFMRDRLVDGGFDPRRIHLMRYPVNELAVLPKTRTANRPHKAYIIYFGRLSYEKGLDTLVRAFQELSEPLDLLLVGRSQEGEAQRLKNLIRPDQAARIHFTGFKSGKELQRLIAGACFSVVPSRWYDNAPISVYESFSLETPVVAADIGGIPEQIRDGVNGKLFPPDSQPGLLEAMRWMLADPKRLQQMGRAGRDYVANELSLADHTKALTQLFESLAKQRGRA